MATFRKYWSQIYISNIHKQRMIQVMRGSWPLRCQSPIMEAAAKPTGAVAHPCATHTHTHIEGSDLKKKKKEATSCLAKPLQQ